ncbi:hypothetical protein [Mammaliicoccus sciuri]|nr:hypothetical protein [Mammaliicoccus sciuri]MEB8132900.1 hypothetical protein [Mammaliicoccus sciuri]
MEEPSTLLTVVGLVIIISIVAMLIMKKISPVGYCTPKVRVKKLTLGVF